MRVEGEGVALLALAIMDAHMCVSVHCMNEKISGWLMLFHICTVGCLVDISIIFEFMVIMYTGSSLIPS